MRPIPTLAGLLMLVSGLLPAPPAAAQGIQQRLIEQAQQPSTDADRTRAATSLPRDAGRKLVFVRPQDADPAISTYKQDSIAITYPAVPSNGKLLVFLPGTYGRPAGYQMILDTAAKAGFHTLGLEYVDAGTDPGSAMVMQVCSRSEDPQCAGSLRGARAFGGQADNGQSVSKPDSIVSRIGAALRYLDRIQKGAGWGAFVNGAEPAWGRIVLAGHSQGAGMAAFIAKRYSLDRVVLISGGADGNVRTREPAAWVRGPSATPPDRWYAMANADEGHANLMMLGLAALGVPGKPTNWSGSAQDGHIFLVNGEPRSRGKHESTVNDAATPVNDNGPVYAGLWRYLIGG